MTGTMVTAKLRTAQRDVMGKAGQGRERGAARDIFSTLIVKDPTAYSIYLWLFTVLLFGRVLGQIIVAVYGPRWLPPMEQWQSGLLPYPVLLASQTAVLTLMVWISTDFARGAGFWVEPQPYLGPAALWWSYLYVGAMVARYIVRMARRPDQRWLGGTVPILFHCVVAAFQWTFGIYHITPS